MAPEIRTVASVRVGLLLLATSLLLSRPYVQEANVAELGDRLAILKPEDVARVPIVLEGLVVRDNAPVSAAKASSIDGGFVQLWKARIRIENTLQGDLAEREAEI